MKMRYGSTVDFRFKKKYGKCTGGNFEYQAS